jgi:hypothetical protein
MGFNGFFWLMLIGGTAFFFLSGQTTPSLTIFLIIGAIMSFFCAWIATSIGSLMT